MENVVNNDALGAGNTSTIRISMQGATTTITSTAATGIVRGIKVYSTPASPTSMPVSSPASPIMNQINGDVLLAVSPAPASGVASNQYHNTHHYSPALCTPVKRSVSQLQQQQQQSPEIIISDKNNGNGMLFHTLREKLRTPGAHGSVGLDMLQSMRMELRCAKPLNVIKERYLLSSHRYEMSAAAAAKTPASYRHLIDPTSSHLRCTDVFTEKQYLCKIINEPLYKVQRAYFQLLHQDSCHSNVYGHQLIRGVHDIVPLNEQRTYVIIAPPPTPTTSWSDETDDCDKENAESIKTPPAATTTTTTTAINANGVDYYFEDLHTYIRNKRRLCEAEARALFHQICQTVQVCHRNGVILRDLKLKRFYFIDEARTKLQYESLEGSMILDDPLDDTLKDKIGCPLYTAPELLCPNTTYRGKPADMWSLGVLLYTMLVGQYPFYEKGNCSLITVIRHCQVQIPSMLTRSVRWLLLSLLRKNHDERMRAEHIFLTPWLREQRPYYMYIPATISIPDTNDDTDDDEDGNEDVNVNVNIKRNKIDKDHNNDNEDSEDDDDNEEYEDDDDGDDDDDDDDQQQLEDEDIYDDDLDNASIEVNVGIETESEISENDFDEAMATDDDDDDDVDIDDNANDNAGNDNLNELQVNSNTNENLGQQQQQQQQESNQEAESLQNTRTARETNATAAANEPLDYTCATLQFECNTSTMNVDHEMSTAATSAPVSSTSASMPTLTENVITTTTTLPSSSIIFDDIIDVEMD